MVSDRNKRLSWSGPTSFPMVYVVVNRRLHLNVGIVVYGKPALSLGYEVSQGRQTTQSLQPHDAVAT